MNDRCKCGARLAAGRVGRCPACLLEAGLENPEPLELETLGPYEILSRLGTGGMGVVYRARDSRLDREVAIKVLPDLVASDPERIARFRREARVAASLNHPNIAGVYGFEDEGGAHFLVMELVEGPTLAERLRTGALPIDESLAIVAQIAEGLEAAHDNGVVHRDLKPSNIKITPDGKAKILDFGLAKPLDKPGPASASDRDRSPAITAAHSTTPGIVFGTVPYMSPEQARGRPLDRRSDIWSLGCVLYECLAGRRAFEGDTATDVVAKILERDPDWEALPVRTPQRVRELLERCLEKDLKRRTRDSGDVRIELTRAQEAREWSSSAFLRLRSSARPRFRNALPWLVAGAASVGLLVMVARGRTTAGTGAQGARVPAIPMQVNVTDPDFPRVPYEDAPTVAIAPDGMTIAYLGKTPGAPYGERLYLRRADEAAARVVDLSCGTTPVYDPFFSPDGKWLGCSCAGLYKIPLSGGSPVKLTETSSFAKGAAWSSRGIVYAPAAKSGLALVKEAGGPLETLTVPDASKGEVSHRWPSALPDGRHVLFTIKKEGITSFDQADIALLDLESRSWTTLVRGGTFARYLPTGQIVFARGDALMAVPFDLDRERVTGEPLNILNGVMTEPGSGAAQYAIAPDAGTLVFVPGGVNVGRVELAWVDRKGTLTPVGAPLVPLHNPIVSPDGSRVAMTVWGATDTVAVYDLAKRSLTRLPTQGNAIFLDWTPDGRQILFRSDLVGRGKQTLYLTPADGSGQPRALPLDMAERVLVECLVPHDRGPRIVYFESGSHWLGDLEGRSTPQRLGGENLTGSVSVSPDSRWLAYESDASGRSEVYITPLSAGGGVWQVSRGGGGDPRWSPRGDEVLYKRTSGNDAWITSVPISTDHGQITTSAPHDLFKIPPDVAVGGFRPDGQRLIALKILPPQFKGDRVIAVLNWFEQVRARTSLP